MRYKPIFSPDFQRDLKQFKKDPVTLARVDKKAREIVQNPERYKRLKNVLKGEERVQIGSFVMKFKVEGDEVVFISFEHHDKAYE